MRETASNGSDDNGATAQGSEGKNVSEGEYKDLARRVESMESSVGLVVAKIDSMITKLDTYEKPQDKRRLTVPQHVCSIIPKPFLFLNLSLSFYQIPTIDSYGDAMHSMVNIDFDTVSFSHVNTSIRLSYFRHIKLTEYFQYVSN